MTKNDKSLKTSVRIGIFCLIGFLWWSFVSHAGGPQTVTDSNRMGEDLYREACSSCHGIDGKGAAQHRVGFDLPLPDFTDCSFATREPDADWIAIAHQGGPIRGFSEIMPAFGHALSFEEIGLIIAHTRQFCPDDNWPAGDLNMPRSLVTEKAYPEDEAVYIVGVDVEGQLAVSNSIVFEKRFGARNQFEVLIPFGWQEQETTGSGSINGENWRGGVGDIAFGAKRALFHNNHSGTIFSVTGEIVLPTGDSEKGFGKGTTVFEPFVSLGQMLPSEFFVQSQVGFEFPIDTDRAAQEGFWRFSLGRSFTSGLFGRTWSPMCEFLGARELVAGEQTHWDMVPQMQVTLNRRQHIMLNVGVRLPLTDSSARDTQLLFYLLWDWFDGGFLSGW
jgi:mono/diheme cytochrome c family protein